MRRTCSGSLPSDDSLLVRPAASGALPLLPMRRILPGIPAPAQLMTSPEQTRSRPPKATPTEPSATREPAPEHADHARAPLIVGIGASAGGLEAYRTFFGHMEANEDIAFVLVQHLAPDKSSLLAELIAKGTDMPVQEATDGTVVEGRHVYVIPPDATLTIQHGVLQLSKPA